MTPIFFLRKLQDLRYSVLNPLLPFPIIEDPIQGCLTVKPIADIIYLYLGLKEHYVCIVFIKTAKILALGSSSLGMPNPFEGAALVFEDRRETWIPFVVSHTR